MSVIDDLITDRTESDVLTVKTLKSKIMDGTATATDITNYLTAQKGCYNFADINRVNNAIIYVKNRLSEISVNVSLIAATTYGINDIPIYSEMNALIQNLNAIRNALTVPTNCPKIPTSMAFLTFEIANNIESMLKFVNNLVLNVKAEFKHCGGVMTICGLGGVIS